MRLKLTMCLKLQITMARQPVNVAAATSSASQTCPRPSWSDRRRNDCLKKVELGGMVYVEMIGMTTSEAIVERLKSLPYPVQKEILDFVEFLESKQAGSDVSDSEWNKFSLASAMRGTEDENPPYIRDDLKVSFRD
jgi:hypothetical protein